MAGSASRQRTVGPGATQQADVRTDTASLLPVAVLAGGLGTRLGDAARHTPKALVPVAGEPFVYHQLRLLARQGARRVVLCVGHLGDQIHEAVGDGRRFGVDVVYAFDGPEPIGTAGALRRALPLLGDAFLVTYGDAYLTIDHASVQRAFEAGRRPGLMTVLENDGAWGPSNAVYADGKVSAYDKRVPPAERAGSTTACLPSSRRCFGKAGRMTSRSSARNSPPPGVWPAFRHTIASTRSALPRRSGRSTSCFARLCPTPDGIGDPRVRSPP